MVINLCYNCYKNESAEGDYMCYNSNREIQTGQTVMNKNNSNRVETEAHSITNDEKSRHAKMTQM